MSNASVIKPGLLVGLHTTVSGGVTYERVDVITGEKLVDGTEVSEWKTKRTITDPEEYERATKCRAQIRALVTKLCAQTSFGLLCANDQEGALDEVVKTTRQLADNFNDAAKHSRISVYVLKGRVASDDAEAARAITQEIAALAVKMDAGIKAFDPKAIRDAANSARELSSMLSEEKQTKINGAIEQARKAARTIVKRIETEGEDRSLVLMDIQRGQIESARIAFLDMSGGSADVAEQMPAVAAQRFADLDVSDVEESVAQEAQ